MTFYRERLWASAWLYISTALVIPASLLVFLPINITAGIVSAIVLYSGCVLTLIGTAPTIEITDGFFIAGRARLPIEFLGDVKGFEADEATLERGQRLDARAWLLIRGWVRDVVRVDVMDPDDPTPYWIVSTRHPSEIVKAVALAKANTTAH